MSPHSIRCPQCSGELSVEEVGRLRDKWLACEYCGHRIDVPDEFEITRTTEEQTAGGSRRVEVTERRRDLSTRERLDPRRAVEDELRRLSVLPEGFGFPEGARLEPGQSFTVEVEEGTPVVEGRLVVGGPHAGEAHALDEDELKRLLEGGELLLEPADGSAVRPLRPGEADGLRSALGHHPRLETGTVNVSRRTVTRQWTGGDASGDGRTAPPRPARRRSARRRPKPRSERDGGGAAGTFQAATTLIIWLVVLVVVLGLVVVALR